MKIAEVSERYGISSDTLRYYERIELIPPLNWISWITKLKCMKTLF